MAESLTTAEVERIAALARLALTEDEKVLYAVQLARILDYASQVAELDTDEVETTSPVPSDSPLERADAVRPSLDRAAALSNAPDPAALFFRVPRVLGDA